ncbi:hypothetical protein KEM52_001121, partial [Ascosphaera acerosa]
MAATAVTTNEALSALTRSWDDTLRFYLNGTRVVLEDVDPALTILEYLRGIGLTGTKLGCAEGGCGACTVVGYSQAQRARRQQSLQSADEQSQVLSQLDLTTRRVHHASVNACLAPLVCVDGKHLITVEGIGNAQKPHPIQERLAGSNGSQCGFCTPGIVMSLYALLRNDKAPTEQAIEEAFDGNLCRCTGYRPILDAAQSFSCDKVKGRVDAGCCRGSAPTAAECCRSRSSQHSDQRSRDAQHPSTSKSNQHDATTELIFPPALHKHQYKALAFGNKRKRWYRPTTVQELLSIKAALPRAKIIGGSSETQIEVKFKGMLYDVSVYVGDIAELKQYRLCDDHVEFGANISLTNLEHVCDEALARYGPERGQPFAAVKQQLLYFAGRQIRNVASPAGNIATASPISDLNPVLMATNSVVVSKSLSEVAEYPLTNFFRGYRKTALPDDAIIDKVRVPICAARGEFIRAYKQSKRKDDDIAIVTCALRVRLSDDLVVEDASLIYGGMASTTVPAGTTERTLVGRKWADFETLESAISALEQDFDLPSCVPGGMASYRRTLALSFFYRFYHDVLSHMPASSAAEVDAEAVQTLQRAVSQGSRDNESSIAYEQRVLGKAIPHVAALKQATGEAQYVDDIPPQKNELYGCLVLTTIPKGKLLSVDFQPALGIPGVVDFVTHEDVVSPEANYWGGPVHDEPFFVVDEITAAGQPIGMVLATSAHAAELGMRAVKIEQEAGTPILTIEEAVQQRAFFTGIEPYIRKGDTGGAFARADHVFTGSTRIGGQEHFYLETQATVVTPKPEDGEMEIFSSTQNPTETQAFVAQVTGVAENKIIARTKRLGGGFGGKESRATQLGAICAVAAKKTKRPVRAMLNRDEDILTSGQRHPFRGDWKVAVSADGRLLALDADVFANSGHTQDLSRAVLERALSHIDNCYYFPNVFVRGRLCRTNTVSNTAFRGFGGPQGLFIAESLMTEIAEQVGIPVETFKRMNMYDVEAGQTTHFNQLIGDWHVPLMFDQLMQEADVDKRRKEIDTYNAEHKWTKRGLAVVPTKFGISFTAVFLNQAGALVHCYRDGSVLVAHGGVEMGQGLNTKMTMIAAEALQVPVTDVHISETSTATVANTSPTAASAASDLNGFAIQNACDAINARLRPYREKSPGAPFKDIVNAAYMDRVNLSANGHYRTPEIGYKWGENTGKMFYYFTQG